MIAGGSFYLKKHILRLAEFVCSILAEVEETNLTNAGSFGVDSLFSYPHVLKTAPDALASMSFATRLFKHSAVRSYDTCAHEGG